MSGLAFSLLGVGAYLAYCGYSNVAPVQTLTAILQNPGNARAIVANKKYKIDPLGGTSNSVMPAAVNAAATTPGSVTNTTGTGGIVAFARTQIGKPYIFGGTGNPGWDCSGLTMAALNQIGVSVPHSATAQYLSSKGKFVRNGDGTKPSLKNLDALQPGDIVFPYAPLPGGDVGHVGIYSGNGNFIEAAHPGTNVREIKLYSLFDAKRFG